ncbi:MAG: hypothetical protein AB7H80_08605 [Candidatus Kapaibacterium sp.]
MMRLSLLLTLAIFLPRIICGQTTDVFAIADSIEAEGRLLYQLERASWVGTDIVVEKHKEQLEKAGGYLSYVMGEKVRCIFFSASEKPEALITIDFDSDIAPESAQVSTTARPLTGEEKNLYAVREAAVERVSVDTMFKFYNNTSLNLIPLIRGERREVYILTGPQQSGVVIFGNDYLITLDQKNKVVTATQLHKNLIPIPYNPDDTTENPTSMHSHKESTEPWMTVTDVCTLLLYADYLPWEQHTVVAEDYISWWNFEEQNLVILTREAWDKIVKHQSELQKEVE